MHEAVLTSPKEPYDPIDPSMTAHLAEVWEVDLAGAQPLSGGEESLVWMARRDDVPVVVRVGPAWRTTRELDWAYGVVSRLAERRQVVPRPLHPRAWRGPTAEWVTRYADRPVSVHQWTPGAMEPVTSSVQVSAVATLLADVHRTLDELGTIPPRPDHRTWPVSESAPPEPSRLVDADLDR